jgi:hypothetical protein
MVKMWATVKVPAENADAVSIQLQGLGVENIERTEVPYGKFVRESRLNYDCAFRQMWDEKKDVAYLRFCFDDSAAGRDAAFQLEHGFMQIPLNLRYE